MRKFTLINAEGKRYDLTSLSSFLQNPKNLGMERKVDYEQVGNAFLPVQNQLRQKKPQGEIVFESYEEYFEFAKFIQKIPLTLEYIAADTFYLDVYVTKLEKSELDAGNLLYCTVRMESLGTYYKKVAIRSGSAYRGKKYAYTYPYTYAEFKAGTITIESDTDLQSPIKISIMGPCKNPTWSQSVNGAVIMTGKVTAEIEEGKKLVVDTTQTPYTIKEYTINNELVKDCYKSSDFSTKRFATIRRGKNTLTFGHEGTGDIKVIVEAKILYEAV